MKSIFRSAPSYNSSLGAVKSRSDGFFKRTLPLIWANERADRMNFRVRYASDNCKNLICREYGSRSAIVVRVRESSQTEAHIRVRNGDRRPQVEVSGMDEAQPHMSLRVFTIQGSILTFFASLRSWIVNRLLSAIFISRFQSNELQQPYVAQRLKQLPFLSASSPILAESRVESQGHRLFCVDTG